jgi:hypothetical protein
VVDEEEGPEMRDRLREERTLWVTDMISQDKFPDDLEAFYLMKNPPPPEPKEEEDKGGKDGELKGGERGGEGKEEGTEGKGVGRRGGSGKEGRGGEWRLRAWFLWVMCGAMGG